MRLSRRFALGILAAGMLAACGAPTPGADPVSAVTPIYTPYVTEAANPPPLKEAAPWTGEMRELLSALDERTREAEGGGLDFNPLIDGQDYEITNLEVTVESLPEAGKAVVRAAFDNFGEPVVVYYDLAQADGGWRVDDVHTDAWTLRALLADQGVTPESPQASAP